MAQGWEIVRPDDVEDHYAESDVPGEFRRIGAALGAEQLAMSLIRVPPHCDFEQGTGHTHDEIEEIYLVLGGTLTMRFDDQIEKVTAPAIVRVAPEVARSHRNEGDEAVEIWAISVANAGDGNLIKAFWPASPDAAQHRGA
ncbi:MAG: cupin domain-containing protein [Solirubrobacterales bacterium]